MPEIHKSLLGQDLTKTDKTDLAENLALILVEHPELEQIVLAWPDLPENIKAAISLLVQVRSS